MICEGEYGVKHIPHELGTRSGICNMCEGYRRGIAERDAEIAEREAEIERLREALKQITEPTGLRAAQAYAAKADAARAALAGRFVESGAELAKRYGFKPHGLSLTCALGIDPSKGAGEVSASNFIVRMTCCGRDLGERTFTTWQEADDFREAYLSGPGVAPDSPNGHVRSAIIVDASYSVSL